MIIMKKKIYLAMLAVCFALTASACGDGGAVITAVSYTHLDVYKRQLQVLVMGRTLVEDGRWRMVLDYLKQEIFVGEDLYVFEAEDAGEILNWHGEDNSSAGEYLSLIHI